MIEQIYKQNIALAKLLRAKAKALTGTGSTAEQHEMADKLTAAADVLLQIVGLCQRA